MSGTFCRNGPSGASHKRFLTPFPPEQFNSVIRLSRPLSSPGGRAMHGPGVGIDGMDSDLGRPGGRCQREHPRTAADVEHRIARADFHAVEHLPAPASMRRCANTPGRLRACRSRPRSRKAKRQEKSLIFPAAADFAQINHALLRRPAHYRADELLHFFMQPAIVAIVAAGQQPAAGASVRVPTAAGREPIPLLLVPTAAGRPGRSLQRENRPRIGSSNSPGAVGELAVPTRLVQIQIVAMHLLLRKVDGGRHGQLSHSSEVQRIRVADSSAAGQSRVFLRPRRRTAGPITT